MSRFTFEFVKCGDQVLTVDEAVEFYGQRMVEYCSNILMIVEIEAENCYEAREKMLGIMKQIVNYSTNSPTIFI